MEGETSSWTTIILYASGITTQCLSLSSGWLQIFKVTIYNTGQKPLSDDAMRALMGVNNQNPNYMTLHFDSRTHKKEYVLGKFKELSPIEIIIREGSLAEIKVSLECVYYDQNGQIKIANGPLHLTKHPYQTGHANQLRLLDSYTISLINDFQPQKTDVLDKVVIRSTGQEPFDFDLIIQLTP